MPFRLASWIDFINKITDTLRPEASAAIMFYRGRYSPLMAPGGSREVTFSTREDAQEYIDFLAAEINEKTSLTMTSKIWNSSGKFHIEYSLFS